MRKSTRRQLGKFTEFQIRQIQHRCIACRAITFENTIAPAVFQGVFRPRPAHHLLDHWRLYRTTGPGIELSVEHAVLLTQGFNSRKPGLGTLPLLGKLIEHAVERVVDTVAKTF
ncbi:hypothetical protein D3C87_1244580 [compost metagenome]